jgi:DNA-binding response OmpR family regulator
LAINDDDDFLTLLDVIFRDAGYAYASVRGAANGLTRAIETQPDLILPDWSLAGLGGAAVITQLRLNGIRAPIIVFRGAWYRWMPRSHPGVAAFIDKPFELKELLALVARYCPP